MAYDTPVAIKGGNPNDDVYTGDKVFPVAKFRELVQEQTYSNSDGYGHPAKGGKNILILTDLTVKVRPSTVNEIPADATHIVWFNR